MDEYDTPMQEAYMNSYWEELVSFTRSMFNAAFKTNPYPDRAIMTGITRVSRKSIFSDLNNLKIVTTTSDEYADCFGFTEKEVFQALDEYGRLGVIDAAREIVERDFDYVLAHLVGIVGVVGERLRVGYHYENLLERARVLQLDALAERTHIVSQMELARGAVARKYYFTHRYIA